MSLQKLQAPRSKIQRNPKLQIPNSKKIPNLKSQKLELGIWRFSGAWSLVLGAYFQRSLELKFGA